MLVHSSHVVAGNDLLCRNTESILFLAMLSIYSRIMTIRRNLQESETVHFDL